MGGEGQAQLPGHNETFASPVTSGAYARGGGVLGRLNTPNGSEKKIEEGNKNVVVPPPPHPHSDFFRPGAASWHACNVKTPPPP